MKNKFKSIFFIIESLHFGGAERVLSEVANFLDEQGYCVNVITFTQGEKEYKLNASIHRINLELPKSGREKLLCGRKSLSKALRVENAEICISFDILANILLILSKPKNCKAIISERNAPKQTSISIYSKILRAITYEKSDWCVFQTKDAQQYYSKKMQRKSNIIPNPVRSNLPFRNQDGIKKEIIAIGRLEKQKNYESMLDGFKLFLESHDDYTLKIFGDGSMRQILENKVKNMKIENNVKFMGSRSDVHNEIRKSEVFLMTSDYEGIPNALMEAMAMGFPVIAHDCPSGGVSLLIDNNVNGILLENQKSITICNALCSVVEDEKFQKLLSEKAKEIRERFSIEKIGENWMELIDKF